MFKMKNTAVDIILEKYRRVEVCVKEGGGCSDQSKRRTPVLPSCKKLKYSPIKNLKCLHSMKEARVKK
jgi:hypothetical protein